MRNDPGSPTAKPATNVARSGIWLERTAFLILLMVVAIRPMIQETHSAEQHMLVAAFSAGGNFGPLITVVLGMMLLVAWALTILGNALRGQPLPRVGVEWPVIVLVLVVAVSCTVASNKRIAITASTDWILLLSVALTLYWLVSSFRQARLVICVVLATAGTFAVQCVIQRTVEFDQTIRLYEENREQIWQARGIDFDSPEVALFERRLRAKEVSGFFAHSNVAGGYLAMCALAGMGLAGSKLRGAPLPMRKGFGVVALGVAVLIALPIAWAGSKGALIAVSCGILLAVALLLFKPLRRKPARTFWLGWGLFVLLIAAVVGYGVSRGGLPGASMNFRWRYWADTAPLVEDHWVRGVGTANFGEHYLRYKPITSPEEIKDPHNVLVRAAAEWGLPGAAAMLWLLVAGSKAMALPRRNKPVRTRAHDREREWDMNPWLLGAVIFVAIVLGRTIAQGFDSVAYFIVASLTPAATWLLLYVLLIMDTNRLDGPADDPPVGLAVWLGGAALAFFLHNLVSFSWFIGGAGTTFMAVFAVAVFLRSQEEDRPTGHAAPAVRPLWWRAILPIGVITPAYVIWVLLPVVKTDLRLSAARRAVEEGAGNFEAAQTHYEQAVRADPWDPAPAAEYARVLARSSADSPEDALARLDRAAETVQLAQERDPAKPGHPRLAAAIADRRFSLTQDAADARKAVEATKRAIRLNPSQPLLYEALGDRLITWARVAGNNETISEAAEAYRRALDLDAARPAEELRRFSKQKVESIRVKLDECCSP